MKCVINTTAVIVMSWNKLQQDFTCTRNK